MGVFVPSKRIEKILDTVKYRLEHDVPDESHRESQGILTQKALLDLGFDFTSSVIIGKESFKQLYFGIIARTVPPKWKTLDYSNNKTKQTMISILEKPIENGFLVGDGKPPLTTAVAGAPVFPHSKLIVIDIDAHDQKKSVDTALVVEGIITLLNCQESCYVEASMVFDSKKNRGYHIYFKTKEYESVETLEALKTTIHDIFGARVEIYSKNTPRAIRFPFSFAYSCGGLFSKEEHVFKKIHGETSIVLTPLEYINPSSAVPITPLVFSTREAALFINELPPVSLRQGIKPPDPDSHKRIPLSLEVENIPRAQRIGSKALKQEIVSSYSYGCGTRVSNQFGIANACIRYGLSYSDFVEMAEQANDGSSKDMKRGAHIVDRLLRSVWDYAESHFNSTVVKPVAGRVTRTSNPTTKTEYIWKERELTDLEFQALETIYHDYILPRMDFKSKTPKYLIDNCLVYTSVLYEFLLQEKEETLDRSKRKYLDPHLAPLNGFVDLPMTELKAYCTKLRVPFETMKKILRIMTDIGLVRVGRDARGNFYRKGEFCRHYYPRHPAFFLKKITQPAVEMRHIGFEQIQMNIIDLDSRKIHTNVTAGGPYIFSLYDTHSILVSRRIQSIAPPSALCHDKHIIDEASGYAEVSSINPGSSSVRGPP